MLRERVPPLPLPLNGERTPAVCVSRIAPYLLSDSQIAGRTSPGLLDLVAAVATGFAGAIALARRDVAAVLPGVAIAISLVPPLAVVGVCLGQGAVVLAVGALLLFVSNLLALVLAGTIVYTTLGYAIEGPVIRQNSRRRVRLAIGALLLAAAVPLVANTVGNVLVSFWAARIQSEAEQWVSSVPGASVTGVEFVGTTAHVHVQTPGQVPPVHDLVSALDGQVPGGMPVVVETSLGESIQAGTVGG